MTASNTIKPRRKLPKRLHLPDCNSLAFARHDTLDTQKCDCGMPLAILPHSRTIVRRYSERRGKVCLVVIPKSQLLEGEEDLAASKLDLKVDIQEWVRKQSRAERKEAWSTRHPSTYV